MKSSLAPGLTSAKRIIVDDARVIGFLGEEYRVYATPRAISDIEYTCRNFLLDHLDVGEDSVGTRVNVEHVGPALLGAEVTIAIKVAGIDGRRVTFEATVQEGDDQVLRGTHERFIVDVEKVRARLAQKRAARQRP